jgi:hypothetical protein
VSLSLSARRRLTLAFLALGCAAPAVLSAQARTQFTPFFASFYALTPYASNIDEFGTGQKFHERLSNAPTIGARLSVAISRAIGIEGQFTYNNAGREASPDSGFGGIYLKGNILMVSGRFTYHPRRSNFRGIFGVGYQKRGGDAWDEKNFAAFKAAGGKFDKSIFGGVIGFGARANVTPRFSMDLDVEAFLYSSDADQNAKLFTSKFQQDILVSIGVPIGFGK